MLNSIACYDLCNSKYMSYLKCLQKDLRTPKTEPIVHSETVEDTVKKLGTDFPLVLKSSTGTQTGVGVVVVESLRSLKSLIQMQLLYNKYLPIIIQEFIDIEYDIRVVVCENQIVGAMKRNVMSDDIRSNASMGATTEEIELTELEKSECVKAAKSVDGFWVGVDFIPSKDREKIPPYFIEVNSSPGTKYINEINDINVHKMVVKTLMNRDNWT